MDDDRAVRGGPDDSGSRSIVLEAGSLLANKYRLGRTAGFGGMAQLWVATNQATGAEVCVKILVPEKSDDESVERFRREAYAAARLSHRAIVRIFDLVELGADGEATSGKPAALAIVMELLVGETLADYLMKKGQLPLDEAVDIALPFLSALAHAHRAGVVHRDLKPDNIFLATDPDGHVIPKVLDFGVSKMSSVDADGRIGAAAASLTIDGVLMGTPSFMSPEQARGARNVDARSDVFSAGILLYMMLAGQNPFESESFHSVVSAILQRNPLRIASVPEAIWGVLEKALRKEPAERYRDATELGIALRRAAGRTTTTDSGPQSFSTPLASARAIAVPLGGDSIVTVPPVGNAELEDAPSDARSGRFGATTRRPAVRIVAAVLGVALVIVIAAALRSPDGSQGGTSAAPPSASAFVTPMASAASTAATEPRATVEPRATSAPAGAAAARDAGIAVARTTSTSPTQGPTRLPPPTKLPPPDKKNEPSPGGNLKEPSIVRDPGF